MPSLSPAAIAATATDAGAGAGAATGAAEAATPAREPGDGLRGGGFASEGVAVTLDWRRSRVEDTGGMCGAHAGSAAGGCGGGAGSSWPAVASSAAVRAARAAARAACACPGDVSAVTATGSQTNGAFLVLPSTRQRLCPSAPSFTVPCTYKWAAAAGGSGSGVFWRFAGLSM